MSCRHSHHGYVLVDHICHPVTLPPTKTNHALMIYGMEENVLFTGSTYYSTYSLSNMFGYWYDQYILLFPRERPKSRQLSLKLALSKSSVLNLTSTYWYMEVRTIYHKLEFWLTQDKFSTQSHVQLTVMGCCSWWRTNKSFYSNTFISFYLTEFYKFHFLAPLSCEDDSMLRPITLSRRIRRAKWVSFGITVTRLA